jgi:hypothetical protein
MKVGSVETLENRHSTEIIPGSQSRAGDWEGFENRILRSSCDPERQEKFV